MSNLSCEVINGNQIHESVFGDLSKLTPDQAKGIICLVGLGSPVARKVIKHQAINKFNAIKAEAIANPVKTGLVVGLSCATIGAALIGATIVEVKSKGYTVENPMQEGDRGYNRVAAQLSIGVIALGYSLCAGILAHGECTLRQK